MDEDEIITEDGEPVDPGDSGDTSPADEETVPPVDDGGERPDVDWDEEGVDGDADAQQTFTSQPVPPYRAGDLWDDAGGTRVCVNGKAEGESFAATDWVPAEAVEPTPTTTTKTVTFTELIDDFSAESLASYQSRGAVAYALYDDGTRVQVPWSQVQEPEPSIPDTVANEALIIAEATNQHFWHRSTDPDADGAGTGAFVTDEEQDGFLQAIAAGTEPTAARPLHNLLMNAEGILLRAAKRVRAAFSPSGIAFYDGQGNAAANVVAAFGKDGAQIGASGQSHIEMDYHSLKQLDKEGSTYFHVSDLRDESGKLEVTDMFHGDGASKKFSLSLTPTSKNDGMDMADDYTLVVSDNSGGTASILPLLKRLTFSEPPTKDALITLIYKSDDAHAKAYTLGTRGSGKVGAMSVVAGDSCVATDAMSHAEGSETEASGRYSHAEGSETEASGSNSHAEGAQTTASGHSSHAEGYDTKAKGGSSHAEGARTTASGNYSHAEGHYSIASADYAHAQNRGAYAESVAQTAIGQFNVRDANDTYALIIGNGTNENNRSNALTVDWDGDVETAGGVRASGDAWVGGKLSAIGGAAIGAIATLANTFEVALNAIFRAGVRLRSSNIDRDGTAPSSDTWGDSELSFQDMDGERVGFLNVQHHTDGGVSLSIAGEAEATDGTDVYTTLKLVANRDKTGYASLNKRLEVTAPIATTNSAIIIRDGSIDRDGENPAANVWGTYYVMRDKDNEEVAYVQPVQTPDGRMGMNIYVVNEAIGGGSTYTNWIRLFVDKSGKRTYAVADAAAFRNGINAAGVSNQSAQNVNFGAGTGTGQHWTINSNVNASNTTYGGDRSSIVVINNRLDLYDGTKDETLWSAYTTANKPTPAAIGAVSTTTYETVTSSNVGTDIATANTNFSIDTAGSHRAFKRNGVCTIYLTFKTTNALTAGTTYLIGTLKSGWRPYGLTTLSFSSGSRGFTGYTQANGTIRVVPMQSVPASSTFVVGATFVQA